MRLRSVVGRKDNLIPSIMTPELNKLFNKLERIEQMYITDEKDKKLKETGLDYPLRKVHRKYAMELILKIHEQGKMTFTQIHDEIDKKYLRLRELVDTMHTEVLVSDLPGVDLDVASKVLTDMKDQGQKTSMKAKHKKTKKHKKKQKRKQNKTKNRPVKHLTDERYQDLVQKRRSKKRISKSDNKSLDKALNQRFCKCLRTVKYSKKIKKGIQYPICMRSIYKNRGFEVPKGVVKNCSKTKS